MKKAINELNLEFPSHSCNEGFARMAVAGFAAQMDPTLNELEDIKKWYRDFFAPASRKGSGGFLVGFTQNTVQI